MLVVRCSLVVVRCVSAVVCCLLCVDACLRFCWLLSVVCLLWLMCVGCCWLVGVGSGVLFAGCWLLCGVC